MVMIALLSLTLALCACSFSPVQQQAVVAMPTPTTVRVVQTTPVPTINRNMQAVPTAEPRTPDPPTPTPIPTCERPADQPGAAHLVEATLEFRAQTLDVQQRITYINTTDELLSQFALDIEPNRRAGAFTLNTVTVGEAVPVPAYELTGRRLLLDLPEPLGPGCPLTIQLAYFLRVPLIGPDDFTGYFGFGSRQINLAHWLAMTSARQNGEWLIHDNALIGEQTVTENADWNVTLTVNGASDDLEVVGPGTTEHPEPDTWRFTHTNGRDFALSMSEDFRHSSVQTANGVTIDLYSFEDATVETANGPVDGAAHVLEVASRSLAMYSDLFGDYPRSRLVIVQGDFPDGMEFSDLVFVGSDWFRIYTGDPAAYLTFITVHEVAHQWWYARVGSDQAITPWMDEALATYSEFIFIEEYYPSLRDWWWEFRINRYIPEDFDDRRVGGSVYEFSTIREYINVVYLRGSRLLRDLRRDLGTDEFFDWLRRYAEAGQNTVATPNVLWSLLTPEQLEATRETRERYLGS